MPEQEANWHVDIPADEGSQEAKPEATQREIQQPENHTRGLFSSPPAATEPPPLPRIIEAMLFAVPGPLTAVQAAESIRGLTAEQFQQVIFSLQQDYRTQGRPYGIQRHGEGYRLTIRPTFQFMVARLYGGVKEARLTLPVVEALAVVAYRQPITKTEVDSLRGQDSGSMLRQLLRRGLIAVQGKTDNGEVQFVTPQRFLDFFQLAGLDDLPRVDDLPFP